ncbi:hypothetical protein C3747_689g2 [Trypanosoma cruzi]|uniref:Uncharacterized protein n=1 Tax=Trypanosoma cruzi TaxID=5693 RepID=A0A2V2UPS9_TRYCR|nr:hypothetical protein C3747_689g2 [Trypanosoma cruzi]
MPPNARLRIRLIGPSGHKSEYHCATLLGNWQEERMSFGLKDPAKEPLEGQTTYLASYRGTKNDEELLAAKPPGCFAPKHPCSFFSTTATSLRHRRASSPCTSLVTPVRRGTSGQAHSRPSWTKKAYLSGGRKQRHCAVPWDSVGIGPPLELRPPSEETQRRHLWRIAQGVPQKGTTNICKQRVVGTISQQSSRLLDVYRRRSGS